MRMRNCFHTGTTRLFTTAKTTMIFARFQTHYTKKQPLSNCLIHNVSAYQWLAALLQKTPLQTSANSTALFVILWTDSLRRLALARSFELFMTWSKNRCFSINNKKDMLDLSLSSFPPSRLALIAHSLKHGGRRITRSIISSITAAQELACVSWEITLLPWNELLTSPKASYAFLKSSSQEC